jgi:hypothetical protein
MMNRILGLVGFVVSACSFGVSLHPIRKAIRRRGNINTGLDLMVLDGFENLKVANSFCECLCVLYRMGYLLW